MGKANNTIETLLNEYDVALIINLSIASVRRWWLLKVGSLATKIGTVIRHESEDVSAWLNSRPIIGGGYPAEVI